MKRQILIYIILVLYGIGVISGLLIIFTRTKFALKPEISPEKILPFYKKDCIAIINISGPIRLGLRPQQFLAHDAETITHKLRQFGEKEEIKAIILRINSPGGSVAAVQEIYSEILRVRKKDKFVVASLGDIAASGGYYVASACDRIVANPGTLTGSIGVLLEIGNLQELFKKIGVRVETIKSGKFKDSGSPFRKLTPEERNLFQNLINEAYEQFVEAVAEARKMDKETVLSLADGRVFTGTQALKAGLVDLLGSDLDAIELATKMANIKGKPKIITEYSPLEKIINIFGKPRDSISIGEIINKRKIRFEYILE